MTVELSYAEQDFVEQGVKAGRFANAEKAVHEAMRLLKQRDLKPGRAIVEAFAASPHKEIELEQPRPTTFAPAREIEW